MTKPTDYITQIKPTWCPGCSNFGIRTALLTAFSELGLEPRQIAIVCDIGCLGNSANWFNVYGFHGLHGRTVPVAVGAKLANRDLTVLGLAGDGGAYGEGLNHLIEACRSNVDIVLIAANNELYSLTTGQASPTTAKGVKTKSTPQGTIKEGLNPLALALEAGASFIARGYANNPKYLTKIIKKAILHQGFALVDIIQPCLTISKNRVGDYQKKIYQLDDDWPTKNKKQALSKISEQGEKIPVGVFYQEKKPSYLDNLAYLKGSLIKQKKVNVAPFIKKFK